MPDPRGHHWTVCGHDATPANVRDAWEAVLELQTYSRLANQIACGARLKALKHDGIAARELNAFAQLLEDACHDTVDDAARAIRDELERLPDSVTEV